jgi:GNAT superfamily N-acetyltransferase
MASPTQLTLRLATPDDLPAARRLFDEFPYKAIQSAAQRLDRERLLDFYAAGLKGALEKGVSPHWIVEAQENGSPRPIALAGLAEDPWHSGIYGFPMGKIAPFLNAECGMRNVELRKEAGRLLLAAIEAAARERGLQHLSVRLDGEDFPNLHLFEAAGWRTVDVSLKFSRPMPFDAPLIPQPAAARGWRIDLASAEDAGWIRRIGSETHGGTHFLNDPALPREKTRELFARWLDRCLGGLAYKVYVLRGPAGEGRGFVTYLRGISFARAVGRSPIILDFVLLDPAIRGGGLGAWLVAESLTREAGSGFDYCELRTSAHNLGAVMTYEKLGFRCCASDFALHQ